VPATTIYEQRLLRKITRQPSPRHVGIILDGNRRHGRSLGLADPQAIYRLGAQKLDHMLDWCAELAIPAVTLWVFSTDNLQRPPEEVTGIFGGDRNQDGGARVPPADSLSARARVRHWRAQACPFLNARGDPIDRTRDARL
jgi:short-chain Z-isoprenyl diphosphate synthase